MQLATFREKFTFFIGFNPHVKIQVMKTINILMIMMIFQVSSTYGSQYERVKVLEVSASGKTFLLDKGRLEGVQHGDVARVVLQNGKLLSPKFSELGQAEVLKIFANKSMWYFTKSNDAKIDLKKDLDVTIIKERNILKGRRDLDLNRKFVFSGKKPSFNVQRNRFQKNKDNSNGSVPKELIYKDEQFNKGSLNHKTKTPINSDIETIDFKEIELSDSEVYVPELDEDVKFYKASTTDSNREENIKRVENNKIFKSTTRSVEKKVSNLEEGIEELYAEQEREGVTFLQKKGSLRSMYETYRDQKKEEAKVNPRDIEKLKKDEDFWSINMSDSQLRRFFIKSGIYDEYERKRLALENEDGHEIVIRYSYGTQDNSSDLSTSFRSTHYDIYMAYEWHLMKTSPLLKSFSTEVGYKAGVGNYDFGTTNGQSQEKGFKAMLNYYFFNYPTTVNRFCWYIGSGLGLGSSTVTIPDGVKSHEYQYLRFNMGQLGVKYRTSKSDRRKDYLNVGFGLNFNVSLESTVFRVNEVLLDNINGIVRTSDLKYGLGVSVIF